jgi:hypothetical protein
LQKKASAQSKKCCLLSRAQADYHIHDLDIAHDVRNQLMVRRVEKVHAVTASNLFKYCAPYHGVVLFKHHQPLHFSKAQLSDLLSAADEWIVRAAAAVRVARTAGAAHASSATNPTENPNVDPCSRPYNMPAEAVSVLPERRSSPDSGPGRPAAEPDLDTDDGDPPLHPFFLWNCGARAGASQFHGHAQVALTEVQQSGFSVTGRGLFLQVPARTQSCHAVIEWRFGHARSCCGVSMISFPLMAIICLGIQHHSGNCRFYN